MTDPLKDSVTEDRHPLARSLAAQTRFPLILLAPDPDETGLYRRHSIIAKRTHPICSTPRARDFQAGHMFISCPCAWIRSLRCRSYSSHSRVLYAVLYCTACSAVLPRVWSEPMERCCGRGDDGFMPRPARSTTPRHARPVGW